MQVDAISRMSFSELMPTNTNPPSIIPSFAEIYLSTNLENQRIKIHFVDVATTEETLDFSALHTPQKSAISEKVVSAAEAEPTKVSVEANPFIRTILPYAKKAADILGLDPKILIAQAILETGWGLHIAQDASGSSNNIYNIKASRNTTDFIPIKTTEYIDDAPVCMQDNFKKYPSIEASFKDYVSLITRNSRYQNALHQTDDPEKFITAMQEAGYATDPQYSHKILSIYRSEKLAQAMVVAESQKTAHNTRQFSHRR